MVAIAEKSADADAAARARSTVPGADVMTVATKAVTPCRGSAAADLGEPARARGEIGPRGPVDLRVDESRGDEEPCRVEDADACREVGERTWGGHGDDPVLIDQHVPPPKASRRSQPGRRRPPPAPAPSCAFAAGREQCGAERRYRASRGSERHPGREIKRGEEG